MSVDSDDETYPRERSSERDEPDGSQRPGRTQDSGAAGDAEGSQGSEGPEGSEGSRSTQEARARVHEEQIEETVQRTVEEGRARLLRGWAPLVATGLVGGIDVGTGVMALLYVESRTGSKLLGGLAFSIGFIALSLARSELFTEDFLVPVTTVVARQARLRSLWRLWSVTAVANLVGGYIFTYLIISGFPSVRQTAIEAGGHYVELGLGWRAFSLALLGGAVITLMTWMQHGTESMGVRIVPAITTGFLLAGLQLNHAIVNSLLMFAGLQTHHATYGWIQWAQTAGWAALGNMVGGVGLVTLLRLLQVPHKVLENAREPAEIVTDAREKRRSRVSRR